MKKKVKKSKVVSQNFKLKSKAPLGVKIIGIVGFVLAGILILAGLVSLILGLAYLKNSSGINLPADFPKEFIGAFSGNLALGFILFGIIITILAIVFYIVSKALLKGKNWARIVIITFSILGIISDFVDIYNTNYSAIISLLINILVVVYLSISKPVKRFFNK